MHRIRPASPADAAGWARVVLAASPLMVLDQRSEDHEIRTDPADARRAVAEVDDEVVGVARFRAYPDEAHASFQVIVDPAHRRTGLGTALLRELEQHLAASGRTTVKTVVEDDDESRIVSARWGFSITRQLRMAVVDPRAVPEPAPAPAGVIVVPVADVGPRPVWEAHSMLGAAGDRAWSAMTGTLPEHRGRGLALLAKQHVLRAAAAAGITRASTGNDDANVPMLAVNRRLGYQPAASPALAMRVGLA